MRLRLSIWHIRVFAGCLTALSISLVALGGYVRGTGAGLACPDWPLCFGRAIPPSFQSGVAQEVMHRYLASLVSLGALGFSVLAFINRKRYPRIWFFSKIALACLCVQVILGGLTVLMRLNPFIVTAHLALGTIFTQLWGLLALDPLPLATKAQDLHRIERSISTEPRFFSRLILLLGGMVYFQIVLGGFVGSSGAALVCPDIPLCFGALIPDSANYAQLVHMLHRINGVAILLAVLGLALFVRPLSGEKLKKRGHLLGLCGLILLQIVMGLTSVYLQVPVSIAVAHLVVAQLILFGVVSYYRRLYPKRSVFMNAQHVSNDIELGEYGPTKRSFVANIR